MTVDTLHTILEVCTLIGVLILLIAGRFWGHR